MRTSTPVEIKVVGPKVRTIYQQRANGFNREVVRTLSAADAYAEGLKLMAAAREVAEVYGEALSA
jgi:hypothetical protein